MKKIVYIAGPFRGESSWDIEANVRAAECHGLTVARQGMIPLIPHSMYRFFQGTISDSFWLEATSELLKTADAMLLIGNWEDSKGCAMEIEVATREAIPSFTNLMELIAWKDRR